MTADAFYLLSAFFAFGWSLDRWRYSDQASYVYQGIQFSAFADNYPVFCAEIECGGTPLIVSWSIRHVSIEHPPFYKSA